MTNDVKCHSRNFIKISVLIQYETRAFYLINLSCRVTGNTNALAISRPRFVIPFGVWSKLRTYANIDLFHHWLCSRCPLVTRPNDMANYTSTNVGKTNFGKVDRHVRPVM